MNVGGGISLGKEGGILGNILRGYHRKRERKLRD